MGFENEEVNDETAKSFKSGTQIENLSSTRLQNIIKLFQSEVRSIEEAMYYLVPNKEGLWEHKFVPESYFKAPEYCIVCKRNKNENKHENNTEGMKRNMLGVNERLGAFEFDPGSGQRYIDENKVLELKDKKVIHNKMYLNRSFIISNNNSNKASNKTSNMNNRMKNSKRSDIENDITEENANMMDENYEKTSHNNFEFSEKQMDELMMYQEMNENKELLSRKQTFKEGSSPKSCISEPMNQKIAISIKHYNEDQTPKNGNDKVEKLDYKFKPRKSRTGIEIPKFQEPRKSLSKSSSYKNGDTFLRVGEHEEICGICHQSFENHSPDFNLELMYLHNKYGEMMNQVTYMDTVSRPYTSNSMHSMVSRK